MSNLKKKKFFNRKVFSPLKTLISDGRKNIYIHYYGNFSQKVQKSGFGN